MSIDLDYLKSKAGVRRFQVVKLPDREVRMRSLSARERAVVQAAYRDAITGENLGTDSASKRRILSVLLSIVDADGNPCFTGTEAEIEALSEWDAPAVDPLADTVDELSYGAAEDLAKN